MNDMGMCAICGGELESWEIEVLDKHEDRIYLFKKVPVRVCTRCGERYFSSQTVDWMDQVIKSGAEGDGKAETTVVIHRTEEKRAA